jgi:teichoic acid transport system permease protein
MQLIPFMMRTWQYMSGVMFSIQNVSEGKPEWVGIVLRSNPMSCMLEVVRSCLLADPSLPYAYAWLGAAAWALVALLGGFLFFYRGESTYGRG